MIRLTLLLSALWLGLWAPTPARADEYAGQFFVEAAKTPSLFGALSREPFKHVKAAPGSVSEMITRAFCANGMCGFAPTMVHIAKIESGLRCSPGGNGGGMFQFIRGTRRSLGLVNPTSCVANIAAAVRYAARGLAHGVRTGAQMGSWWNSGYAYTARRHLERAYRVAGL